LLVWGGVSLAAISGAALVYAHGGLPTEPVSSAVATPRQIQAAEIVPEVLPGARPVRVIALHPATAAPAPALASAPVAKASSARLSAAAAAPIVEPPPEPVILAAAIPSALSSETASLPEMPAADEAQETTIEARLPRPRPEASAEPVETASIERQWANLRAARFGRSDPMRARLLYRYRMAPL
jgi:hypothetical protein